MSTLCNTLYMMKYDLVVVFGGVSGSKCCQRALFLSVKCEVRVTRALYRRTTVWGSRCSATAITVCLDCRYLVRVTPATVSVWHSTWSAPSGQILPVHVGGLFTYRLIGAQTISENISRIYLRVINRQITRKWIIAFSTAIENFQKNVLINYADDSRTTRFIRSSDSPVFHLTFKWPQNDLILCCT